MKNVTTTMRYFTCATMICTSTFLVASCNNSDKSEDPKEIAEEQNDEQFDDRKTEKDAQFLVEAAAINMEEIELGKLAQQKSTMADVKDLGKMMEKEHAKTLADLKKLAASKSVTLPAAQTEDGQKAYETLNEKSGKDFDKEYCDRMVKGHKDAIKKFEKASDNAEDADIRNWASSMIPSLNTHLEHAEMCQKKCTSN